MRALQITITGLMWGMPVAGLAQDVQPAPKQLTALQSCRARPDATDRLACYDRSVDALLAATARRDLVVIDRAEVKSARRGLFGFSLPKLSFLTGRPGDRADEEEADQFQSKIISSRSFGYDLWRFSVEEGGVWETVEASRSFADPRPGQIVSIERGTMGSYRAKIGRGRSILVRRIQ